MFSSALCSSYLKIFSRLSGGALFLLAIFSLIYTSFVLLTVPITSAPVIFCNINTQDLDIFVQLHYYH